MHSHAHARRHILVCALLALSLGGCDALGLGSSQRQVGSQDAAICVRDLEAMQGLLVNPQACVTDSTCPAGTFCNGDTGACDWQCAQDSDCGGSDVCGCNGVCGAAGGGGPDPQIDCARNPALLASLATSPRSCVFDEECPNGSHCDEQTAECRFECVSTGDPVAGCASGSYCDCFGRCSAPGADPEIPDDRQVRLDVTPGRLPVIELSGGAAAWPARRLEVALRAPDAMTAMTTLDEDVHVAAGAGLQVACDDTGASVPATFAAGCELSSAWSFQPLGSQRHAVKYVWVRPAAPVPPATLYASTGDVTFSSDRLAGSPAVAQFTPPMARADGQPAGTAYTFAGEYTGVVTFLGVSSSPDYDGPRPNLSLDIPVRAWATSTSNQWVDLHDAARVIAPTGKLRVGNVSSPLEIAWLAPIDAEAGAAQDALGAITATIQPLTRSSDTGAGTIRGTYRIRLRPAGVAAASELYLTYQYELRQVAPLATCAAGCPEGTACDATLGSGTCTAGPAFVGDVAADNTIAHQRSVAWNNRITSLAGVTAKSLTGNMLCAIIINGGDCNYGYPDLYIGDLYSGTTGFARSSAAAGLSMVNAGRIAAISGSEQGFPLCQSDFFNYFWWLDNSSNVGTPLRAYLVDQASTTPKSSVDSACRDFYQVQELEFCGDVGGCGAGEPAMPAAAKDYAPCIEPTPIAGGTNYFTTLPTDKRGSCTGVYNQWKAATGSAFTEAQFYASVCYDTLEELRFGRQVDAITTYARHRIRLCPFKPQMLGTGDPVTEARRYLCYDRDQTSVAQLESAQFTGVPMYVSGDLGCGGGRVPHGADLVFDADRAASVAGDPIGAASMMQLCLGDLTEAAPVGFVGIGQSVVSAAYHDTFADRPCFSSAPFYAALGTLQPAGDGPAQRLWSRLLAQWIQVHGFLAREGAQSQGLARAVGAATDLDPTDAAATASTPDALELLDQLERGWNLVLAQPNVAKLQSLPKDVLATPDYRNVSMPLAHHEQPVGLPALLLETAAGHLELATSLLREAQLEAYDECRLGGVSATADEALEAAGRAFRYTQSAEALSAGLYDTATARTCAVSADCASGGACTAGRCIAARVLQRDAIVPVWQARYDGALAQYQAARQRALAAAAALGACENPLGLAEGAVPLYFGDVTGLSSQFFAASDYLLTGWAKPAVEQAHVALEGARSSWLQKRDSEIQQVLADQDADRRVEDLSKQYGQQLVDLCGLQGVQAKDALALFTGPNALTADNCYIDRQNGNCSRFLGDQGEGWSFFIANGDPPPPPDDRVTTGEARYTLCLWKELKGELGIASGDIRNTFANGYASASITMSGGEQFVNVGANQRPTEFLYATDLSVVPGDRFDRADATCANLLGGKADPLPSQDDVTPDMTSYAACFRGQLGEQFLAVTGAKKDVDLAVMDWQDAESHYDISASRCIYMEDNLSARQTLLENHNSTMNKMAVARGICSAISGVLSSTFTPEGWSKGGLIGGLFGAASTGLSTAMEVMEREFQEEMQGLEHDLQLYECYSEARTVKLRIDNAATMVERSVIEGDRAVVAFANLHAKVRQVVAEGPAALAREQGRLVPGIAFHYWLDEKVDRFEKDFEWARTLTYLAMLSIEFEYQQSLALRDDILKATHPDQLLDAIRVMEQEQLSRTINGRRPDDDTVVMSLRDDVLGLGDFTPGAAGERQWTALQRFQHRLWSPQYAVFDDAGNYLGQGIPFTLAAEDELEYRCAERVWRVSATVQGDLLSVVEPNVPMMLIKRNHFGSQWCEGKGDGVESYQTASVQPASQLFHPEDRGGDEAAVRGFVTAQLRPWFNVPRSEFYREAYAEGGSEELAGRGMYGEYILLFPASGLLLDGFPLEQVEDVLIRFDYLSVDDLSGL